MIELGTFLKRVKRRVELEPDSLYKLVTIKLYQKGVFLREEKLGRDIKSPMSMVHAGDFVLSGIDARNGAFGIVPEDLHGAVITNDFWCLDVDEDVVLKQLFLELTKVAWFKDICQVCSSGTTQRIRLDKELFFNHCISLPPRDKQEASLGEILRLKGSMAQISGEQDKQEKWLADLRSALLQEAISGQLTADWRAANPDVEPAHVLLERIAEEKAELIRTKQIRKEKPLQPISSDEVPFDIPSTWEWTRIPFTGVMERGVSKHRPRNDEVLYNGGDIPLVQTGEVARSKSNGHVIWEVNDYYNEVGLAQSRLWPAETLCITIAANIAQTGLLSFDACFPDSVVGFNGIDARRELNWFVRSLIEVAQASLERFAPATAQKNINLEILSSLAVPCPPKLELKEIVARLQKQLAKIAELEEGLEQSKEVAQLLMKSKLAEVFEPAMAD